MTDDPEKVWGKSWLATVASSLLDKGQRRVSDFANLAIHKLL